MSADIKKFSFDVNNNVTAMYSVKGTRMKLDSTLNTTFQSETGTYTPSGGSGVVEVTATKIGRGKTETSVYSDQDGDGRFIETFELDVVNSALSRGENYKFDIESGLVTTAYELGKRGWKIDRIEDEESYSVVTTDADTFVLKTEDDHDGVEFEVYVDRDGDGLWSKIADGNTTSTFLDGTGSVDLVGIIDAGLLAPADVVLV